MKIRTYVLVGSLSFGVFAINQLPANLLWRALGAQLSPVLPFAVESVGGSIWNGFVVGRPQGAFNERVLAQWDVKPASLLMGRLALGLKLESSGFRVSGTGYAGLAAKGVYDLSAKANAAMLDPILQGMGVSASGELILKDVSVGLGKDMQVTDASGSLLWRGGTITAGFSGSPEQYSVPPISGIVSQKQNGAFIDVKQVDGAKPLGEVGLTGDGILNVTVLQRVMTLAGMEAGDENKVLIKTQQPVF
jgi:hypothetical protein